MKTIKPNIFYIVTSIIGLLISLIVFYNLEVTFERKVTNFILYWIFTAILMFLLPRKSIGLSFVTDLIDNPKEPTYKFEHVEYIGWVVSKHDVGFDCTTLHLSIILFPLASIFGYKTMVLEESFYATEQEVEDIKALRKTPKEVYESRERKRKEKQEAKETEARLIQDINSEYYNNFKK